MPLTIYVMNALKAHTLVTIMYMLKSIITWDNQDETVETDLKGYQSAIMQKYSKYNHH